MPLGQPVRIALALAALGSAITGGWLAFSGTPQPLHHSPLLAALADISPAGGGDKPKAAKSSHSGKVLTAPPPLPQVMILGRPVVTRQTLLQQQLDTALPPALDNAADRRILAQRIKPITYVHNPSLGPDDALLTILELTDPACQPCMATLAEIDAIIAAHPGKVHLINLYAPVAGGAAVNLAAFYGKVAQRAGVFWEYRRRLQTLTEPTSEKYFQTLIASGVNELQARRLSQSEARRFYRELDADATLVGQMANGAPPQVFINGIHLGEGGIALTKMKDVVTYELNRPREEAPAP